MKRINIAILTIVLFPLLIVTGAYLFCRSMQPLPIYGTATNQKLTTSYLEEDKFYEYASDFKAYPGKILDYSTWLYTSKGGKFISSLSDIRSDEFEVSGNYVATVSFKIKLPTGTDYSLWFPSEFCEYKIYVNGELSKESVTFMGKYPPYATAFYVDLPASDSGEYSILCNFVSPKGYANTNTSAVLIGTKDKVAPSFAGTAHTNLLIMSYILFNIVFMLIQNIAFKKDNRLISFLLISVATLIITSVSDGRSIMLAFPRLPYQLGCFIEAIASPLFLAALLQFTHATFPAYMPNRIKHIFAILLVIPFANALCLGQFKILSYASVLVTVIPYAVCLYVFVLAFENHEKHSAFYGLSVLLVESSVLLFYATQEMAIPAHFAYGIGYIFLGFTVVSIIASEYANQRHEEEFYTAELSKQLEAMQASENAFLNAQMKPHFLYNTLNTIADCCVTDSPKAKSLINSLSEYLKLILSIDNMDKTVPLRRELELAEAYTAIEKERFPSINFYMDFPVRLPSIMMPPLTIQPLIENAIKHGVRKSDKPGVVTLRIVEEADCVEFFVSDNGVGMDEDGINNLFKVPKENKSIGIYNIDKRLKNIYKKGLKVESTPGLGTCVSFKVMKYV